MGARYARYAGSKPPHPQNRRMSTHGAGSVEMEAGRGFPALRPDVRRLRPPPHGSEREVCPPSSAPAAPGFPHLTIGNYDLESQRTVRVLSQWSTCTDSVLHAESTSTDCVCDSQCIDCECMHSESRTSSSHAESLALRVKCLELGASSLDPSPLVDPAWSEGRRGGPHAPTHEAAPNLFYPE